MLQGSIAAKLGTRIERLALRSPQPENPQVFSRVSGQRARLASSPLTAFLLILTLCLCAPAEAQPALSPPVSTQEVRTITVWTHEYVSSPVFRVLHDAADDFNAHHTAYKIDLVSSLYRDYERWVHAAALNGSLPCVMEFDGPFLHELAWSGYLQPIEQFIPPDMLADFLPSIRAQGTYEGHLYSLGQYESGLALWGNRRDLIRAGVRIPSLQKPWTLEEFEQALQKLQALPEIEHAIDMGAYTTSREFPSYAFSPILQGFGGDLIDRKSGGSARATLAGPRSVEAMKHFQLWFARGWASARQDRAAALPRGISALAWSGNWEYWDYRKTLGNNLVLLPLPDFGHGIKSGVGSWTWGISSTCQDPAAAGAFLRLILSGRQMLRMSVTHATMPSRRSVIERSSLYGANGPLRLFVEQIDRGMTVPRPATPAYGTIRQAFAGATADIIAGGDVEPVLREAATRIDDEIALNHGYPSE
jgi:multiple sugar transport system substrate-binding protein